MCKGMCPILTIEIRIHFVRTAHLHVILHNTLIICCPKQAQISEPRLLNNLPYKRIKVLLLQRPCTYCATQHPYIRTLTYQRQCIKLKCMTVAHSHSCVC